MDANNVYMELLNDPNVLAVFEKVYNQKREYKRKKRREEYLFYLKQKAIGLFSVVLGIITPLVLDGDATASIVFIPIGVHFLLTKERLLDL